MRLALVRLLSVHLIAAAATAVGAASSTQPASQPSFPLGARAIHPMSVAPLVGDLADEQPIIGAVDLEGSARTKRNGAAVTEDGGVVRATDGDGYVAYRYVGTTPKGLHVLVVTVNGGGSGAFMDALWVKLVRDRVWENGSERDRTMIVRVGQFALGDRDDGLVSLEAATLRIGKSRYREQDTSILLE
jgi:hypothetical protein